MAEEKLGSFLREDIWVVFCRIYRVLFVMKRLIGLPADAWGQGAARLSRH